MLQCTVIVNKQLKLVKGKKSVLIQKEASPFQLHIHLSVPINDIHVIISDFERTDVF